MLSLASIVLAATSFVIPFTVPDNHIHVPVTIEGHTFDFLFDTGGAASIMPQVENELHLPVIGEGKMFGGGAGAVSVQIVQANAAVLGGAVLNHPHFTVLGGAIAGSAKDFDGIIGREFFPDYAISIDYSAKTLTLTPIAQFAPPAGATAVPLSLRMGVIPSISASIDGHSGAFDIDTGAALGLTLTQPFASSLGTLAAARPMFLGIGAGGDVTGSVTRVRSFSVGASTIENPVAAIAAPTGIFGTPDLAGNIGPDILRRFTLTLDFPAKKAYFIPHSDVNAPVAFNRAGLFMKRVSPTAFQAAMVWSGTPASEAGIAKGDEIIAIDGFTPAQARGKNLFTQAVGTAVNVTFKHGDTVLTRRLLLRDLL